VPTMGALHSGHASLLERARAECGAVVLSIFLNPTQFGPKEDLSKYPRNIDADLRLAKTCGVDVVFLPSTQEMYKRQDVVVHVAGPSTRWEGEFRPAHFDGVATIVTKLFSAIGTCKAYFGLKDLQQCAVVKALVEGLDLPVSLVFCETVREHSGLAMSSRNAYLSPEQQDGATSIYRCLTETAERVQGSDNVEKTDMCLQQAKIQLENKGFKLDYLALVDRDTMEPCPVATPSSHIIVAARWHGVRLIDNIAITSN